LHSKTRKFIISQNNKSMKINQILLAFLVVFAIACGKKEEANELVTKDEVPTVSTASLAGVDDHAGHDHGDAEVKVEEVDPSKLAKFEFEEIQHQFGDINAGDVVEHTFKFKNTGAVPLVITNTQVTCGCTTPSYTKEPVAPGEMGELQVKFNSAGKSGNQNKVVTISANVEGGQDKGTIITTVKPASKEGPLSKN
jgi:hypothetical protein